MPIRGAFRFIFRGVNGRTVCLIGYCFRTLISIDLGRLVIYWVSIGGC